MKNKVVINLLLNLTLTKTLSTLLDSNLDSKHGTIQHQRAYNFMNSVSFFRNIDITFYDFTHFQ